MDLDYKALANAGTWMVLTPIGDGPVAVEWDPAADVLERVLVKPKRGGVSVQLVALTWVPRA